MTSLSVSESMKKISMPRLLLHFEGLIILVSALILYANQDYGWGIFALLLFVPDLPLIFYGINKRFASVAYNSVHTIIFPVIVGFLSYIHGFEIGIQLALIWLAHIGMDRAFGYGFKYLGSMKETHFTRI